MCSPVWETDIDKNWYNTVGVITFEEYCWSFTYWANKKLTKVLADPAALRPPRALSSAVEGTGLGR